MSHTNYYANYRRFKDWDSNSFGRCSRDLGLYFEKELQKSGFAPLTNLLVLEIGYGNGNFATWSTAQGCNYIGIEQIPELIDLGRRQGLKVFDGSIPLSEVTTPNSVDLVIALDVFEHLTYTQVSQWLGELHHLLKPGGKLVGRVPSGDSPFSRAIQYGDLTHQSVFGSKLIRQIAMAAGFEIEAIRPPVFPLLGLGLRVFLRRSLVALGRQVTYPIIKNIFMGGDDAVLTPDTVFVLVKTSLSD